MPKTLLGDIPNDEQFHLNFNRRTKGD